MTRGQKLLANTSFSIFYQIVTITCGFVLPRLFLVAYGSAVNGLMTSITEMLGFISLAECGVGAVVQSSLYAPLARKDLSEISKIVVSAERFFRRIAILLILYIVVLIILYPTIINERFSFVFTATLIIVISVSTFAQYFFGMTYRLLFYADQLSFIPLLIQAMTLIINLFICFVLIKSDFSIHGVKLASSCVFLIQPLFLNIYGKKKYSINKRIVIMEEPIKQKWNGLAQHISFVVLNNTDSFVLTLLSTLENVSIYAVYYLVVNGVKQIISAFTTGTQALFGNILANNEKTVLSKTFDEYECILHMMVSLVFSMTAVLIVPFVVVYTSGIDDANYIVPSFALLITIAQASYCLRLPYNTIVLAAGHYKQTQTSAIIEALLNISISIILVSKYGLIGVAIGTLVAMLYRTIYLAYYVSHNVIDRPFVIFWKRVLVDIICVLIAFFLNKALFDYSLNTVNNYGMWFFVAIRVGCISFLIVFIINYIVYKSTIMYFFNRILRRRQ